MRVEALYKLFIFVGFIILIRLIYVQMISPEIAYNAKRLEGRIFSEETILAQRGGIFTRNGEPLATSLFRYNVTMDFASEGLDSLRQFNEQSDSLSKLLSSFFKDKSSSAYRKFFREEHAKRYRLVNKRDTSYHRSEGLFGQFFDRIRGEEYIKHPVYDTIRDHTPIPIFPRDVDYNEWRELVKYPLLNWNMGMVYNLNKKDQRIYPQGDFARRTIGLSGDKGHYGIESVYSKVLAGEDGNALRQRIARGFYGRVAGSEYKETIDGADITTTLDLDIQDYADKRLRTQLTNHNAIWGTTIVMDVKTGELHALVNLGRNSKGKYVENMNYAIAKRAELGSVYKLATVITLLEQANMSPDKIYDTQDGKRIRIGGASIQDSHDGFTDMNLKTATAQSSNVYFAKAILEHYKDSKSDYTKSLQSLHLDKTVGLEAFGERAPYIPVDWANLRGATPALTRLSIGYIAEITPIQMITLYNAVANDGKMVAPQIIKEIRRGGDLVEEFKPVTLINKICSNSTLDIVKESLEEVFRSGTGMGIFPDTTLFRAAGKTGTAQYSQGGVKYSDGYYIGSMVAYFPVEEPRYTIMTVIHTKRQSGKSYYGRPLAGPVVRDMVNYIFNSNYSRTIESKWGDAEYYPQKIKGGDIEQIREVTKELSPDVEYEHKKGWGRVSVDSLSNVDIRNLDQATDQVPNVRGMGLKDALFLLESRGLRVSFSGVGEVTHQSIRAGTTIRTGALITIKLR